MLYDPHLDIFLKAAEAGSFSKAASEMFITPSAVIKQINLFEKDLGVKLFERSARGLQLTAAGRSLQRAAPDKMFTTFRNVDIGIGVILALLEALLIRSFLKRRKEQQA